MRLKLLFPPHLGFVQPYLSLPVLTAFLRERGVEVSQEDLNISSFDYFMRPTYLAQCAERLERVLATFKGKRSLAPVDYERYWAICSTLLAAPLVIENIQKAVGFLRTRNGFLDFEEYALNERVVQEAFNLLSAVHYPTAISLASFAMQYSPEASEDIFAAIADGAQNPYRAFLEAYVTGHLGREAPDVIGISLAAPSQVIPGLSLASLIRLKMPGTKIVVGGMIPSLLAEKIRDVPRLFTLFDYLIKFEGETPLLRLCQHLEGECAVTQVPNLLYLDKGEVKDTGLNSFEDVNELPTPIYDGLPLDRYLSPVPVLSLEPARGCYWRRCGFCSQHTVHGNTFRIRRPEKTAADMARLQERYETSLFNVVNEGLAAKHLSLLAKAVLERGLHVHWYAGARLEKRLTRERLEVIGRSGCRKVLFGLESGSQRVLDLMEKGIRLEDVPGILTACKDAGVDVHLYLMIGFPTESERERKQTQDFVEAHLDALACDWFTFNVGVFRAEIGAPILEQLPRLGYRLVAKGRKFDLEFLFEHEPADATVPRVSREQREHMANQMVASICKHLPPQRVPEEVAHYMCYRVLHDGKPMLPAVGRTDTKGDTGALSRSGHRLCVSPWVIIRRLRTMDGDAKQPAEVSVRLVSQYVAYNLRLDRCHGLNRAAVELLGSLRHPKTFDDILRRRQPRSVEARRLRRGIADLLNRGLIEVEEVNREAQDRAIAS